MLVRAKYQYQNEKGHIKTLKLQLIVDAHSVTEAEAKAVAFFNDNLEKNYEVTHAITKEYEDIFFNDGENWYESNVDYVEGIKDNGKEKIFKAKILTQANNLEEARVLTNNQIKGSILPYEIKSIKETQIDYVI